MDVSLMEKFADPALFDALTTSEKGAGALITTCMGMGITFIVLILLWGVIVVMSKAIAGTEKKDKEKAVKSQEILKPAAVEVKEEISSIEDAQLVAVITAAIETYEGNNGYSGNKFVVRRIARATGNVWGQAGVTDCTFSRKM